MINSHPISLPVALWDEWIEAGCDGILAACEAARWGADQELEAICAWLELHYPHVYTSRLRRCRRPDPPSLKEQALDELHISFDRGYLKEGAADTIRRALESMPD